MCIASRSSTDRPLPAQPCPALPRPPQAAAPLTSRRCSFSVFRVVCLCPICFSVSDPPTPHFVLLHFKEKGKENLESIYKTQGYDILRTTFTPLHTVRRVYIDPDSLCCFVSRACVLNLSSVKSSHTSNKNTLRTLLKIQGFRCLAMFLT